MAWWSVRLRSTLLFSSAGREVPPCGSPEGRAGTGAQSSRAGGWGQGQRVCAVSVGLRGCSVGTVAPYVESDSFQRAPEEREQQDLSGPTGKLLGDGAPHLLMFLFRHHVGPLE